MLSTPHVIVGAAIGVKFVNPQIAVPVAFASHFILDMAPHWNPKILSEVRKQGTVSQLSQKFIVFDTVLALIAGITIAGLQPIQQSQKLVIIACCFFSVLPDLLSVPYLFLHQTKGIFGWWMSFKKSIQNDVGLFWGNATQTLTIVAAIYWIVS